MSTWTIVVICGCAVFLGAVVQGVIGIGMALLSSPVVALVDPALVPGALIICASVLPIMTTIKEHDDIDWKGLSWAFPFRFIGTAIGAWLVVVLSAQLFGVMLAVVVLAAVGLSLLRWRPMPTPVNLSVGGLISGISGTATSVGGPPIALVYQHARPSVVRCTLGVYFLVGSIVSLISLIIVGSLSWHQVAIAGALLPFVGAGFAVSLWVKPRLNATYARYGVLAASAFSSIVLLVHSLG